MTTVFIILGTLLVIASGYNILCALELARRTRFELAQHGIDEPLPMDQKASIAFVSWNVAFFIGLGLVVGVLVYGFHAIFLGFAGLGFAALFPGLWLRIDGSRQ